jgi:threonine-phosphate decarboxylase
MNFLHGANTAEFGRNIGVEQSEIIDFSSNINFVKPSVKMPSDPSFLYSYESDSYSFLKAEISRKYGLDKENIELYNGASTAIFSLFSFLSPKDVTLYAPIYLEYKKACLLHGASITIVNRLKDFRPPKPNSIAIFVNPATPDGMLYDIEAMLTANCAVIVDESFLDFTDGKSVIPHLENYKNLFVIKSMTKYYGAAGVRIGFIATNAKNIKRLRTKEPLWKLSSFDAYYMSEALKDRKFDTYSKEQNEANKKSLRQTLEESKLFGHIYDGKANFLLAKLSKISADSLQVKLAKRKILIRNCANFDTLDDSFVRFAVKETAHIETLKDTLCVL